MDLLFHRTFLPLFCGNNCSTARLVSLNAARRRVSHRPRFLWLFFSPLFFPRGARFGFASFCQTDFFLGSSFPFCPFQHLFRNDPPSFDLADGRCPVHSNLDRYFNRPYGNRRTIPPLYYRREARPHRSESVDRLRDASSCDLLFLHDRFRCADQFWPDRIFEDHRRIWPCSFPSSDFSDPQPILRSESMDRCIRDFSIAPQFRLRSWSCGFQHPMAKEDGILP